MADAPEQRESFDFPKELRVRCRAAFQAAFKSGVRASDDQLTIWTAANGLPYSRLGIVVGRKYGGAVQRNRLKRLLREAFRLTHHKLPAGRDFLCAPRIGTKPGLTHLVESLTRLAARLEEQLARRGVRRSGNKASIKP